MPAPPEPASALKCLNESPSEKEGKWLRGFPPLNLTYASMKVPPKRKGNLTTAFVGSAENSVPQ